MIIHGYLRITWSISVYIDLSACFIHAYLAMVETDGLYLQIYTYIKLLRGWVGRLTNRRVERPGLDKVTGLDYNLVIPSRRVKIQIQNKGGIRGSVQNQMWFCTLAISVHF